MTEFETPMMRDLEKFATPLLLGLLIGICLFFIVFWPINGMTVYCNGWMETSSYSIGEWIVRSIQC